MASDRDTFNSSRLSGADTWACNMWTKPRVHKLPRHAAKMAAKTMCALCIVSVLYCKVMYTGIKLPNMSRKVLKSDQGHFGHSNPTK